jgi:hypothetical protein
VTAFDGGSLTLTVPAEFAAGAAYPLTIDPLTSATSIATGSGVVDEIAIAAFSNGAGKNTLFALSRFYSVTDIDLYVVACADDYSGAQVVYSDLDSNWSSTNPSVAACEGPARVGRRVPARLPEPEAVQHPGLHPRPQRRVQHRHRAHRDPQRRQHASPRAGRRRDGSDRQQGAARLADRRDRDAGQHDDDRRLRADPRRDHADVLRRRLRAAHGRGRQL